MLQRMAILHFLGAVAATSLPFVLGVAPLTSAQAQEQAGPPADLPSAPAARAAVAPQAAPRAVSNWSAPTSEEDPPVTASNGQLISAMRCNGRYCDNISLGYENVPGANHTSSSWAPYFSEEGTYWRSCAGPSSFVTGISCRGRYCDNISLLCTVVSGKTKSSCKWMPWFSEESEFSYLDDGYHVVGLACRGSYCDDMSILACN